MRAKYKRVLLKISGEALAGTNGFGLDEHTIAHISENIKKIVDMGVQVSIVVGGGNIWRGRSSENMDRTRADHMGMLATVMNGLAMRDALHRADVNAKLMSAFQLNGICDTYNWSEAIKMLREKRVVIFSAGTGSPFFTTDSAACLRGIEIEADIVLKATKVDGVYNCDPAKNPDAVLYRNLSYAEVIEKELQVMDLAAFTLARDHGMPIRVFNMCKPGALRQVVLGTEEGTTIC